MTDVRNQDWYGEDLSGREYTGSAFSGVDDVRNRVDGVLLVGPADVAPEPQATHRASSGAKRSVLVMTVSRSSGAILRANTRACARGGRRSRRAPSPHGRKMMTRGASFTTTSSETKQREADRAARPEAQRG